MSHLLTEIEQFISAHNISASEFGRRAMNDSHFVTDLRDGREIRRKTEQRARSFIAAALAPAEAVSQ